MKQSRRVSPRVPYDEAICLTRRDRRGRLYVRGIDLSASGLHVVSAEPCPIGTELDCTLLLPGGPRTVHGRVVRITALPTGIGLAIGFAPLEPRVATAIRELVSARSRQILPARLRVDGIERPLRCEAALAEGTVRLTANLPFLRLDGDVDVLLGEDEKLAATGVIRRIALDPATDDGTPRLAVEVQLARGTTEKPPRRRRVTQDYAEEPTAPPSSLPPPCGHPLPSVMLAPEIEDTASGDGRLADNRPPRRRLHGTAEVARRFVPEWAWASPPRIAEGSRARVTARIDFATRKARDFVSTLRRRRLRGLLAVPSGWRYWVVVPLAFAISALVKLVASR